MMKSLHIIFALLIINGTLSQQLENSGFEQWENVGTGEEEPLSWSSTKTSDNSSLNGPVSYTHLTLPTRLPV